MESISRRSFVSAAGASLAVGAVAAPVVANAAPELEWADEADIIVVGLGAAGLGAAITAAAEELGSLLVLEVASAEEEGGNSRVCSQILFSPTSVEGGVAYQANLNGDYVVEPELLQAWGEALNENTAWFEELGMPLTPIDSMSPEFPDIEGGEAAQCYIYNEMGGSIIWNVLRDEAASYGVRVENNARVTELVFDPATKEVFGVKTADGRAFKANKGVILACGGFENDPELMRTYYPVGFPGTGFYGSPYNRGDGIRMAQTIGAKLWHMNNFAGPYFGPKIVRPEDMPAEYADANLLSYAPLAFSDSTDFIYVGPDCKRYIDEESTRNGRHGKVWVGGTYTMMRTPSPAWAICGQKTWDYGAPLASLWAGNGWANTIGLNPYDVNQAYLDNGIVVKCENAAEVAAVIGVPEWRAQATLDNYNGYVDASFDPDFHRGEDVYAFGADKDTPGAVPSVEAHQLDKLEPPYYVFRYEGGILNTQGGPKRDKTGNIVDVAGNPIPRLYGAGELGCVYSYNYNGGGNLSEAIASGRLAARSVAALEAWA